MNVTVWADTISACVYYRAVLPLRHLQRAGLIDSYAIGCPSGPDDAPDGDILLSIRLSEGWQADVVESFWRAGGLVAVDDDHDLDEITRETRSSLGQVERFLTLLDRHLPMEPGEGVASYLARGLPWYVEYCWPRRQEIGHGLHDMLAQARGGHREPKDAKETSMQYTGGWLGRELVDILLSARSLAEGKERARRLTARDAFQRILGHADVVSVTTHYLAQVFSERYGCSATVLPNCLDLELPCFQPDRRRRPHDGILLGWAGGYRHWPDFDALSPALKRILTEYDGTSGKPYTRLMLGGDAYACRRAFEKLPGGKAFVRDVMEGNVAEDQRITEGVEYLDSEDGRFRYCYTTTDVEQVPLMYDDVDIGLVPNRPLAPINLAKSDVKGLEMAGMGVPCIASPLRAYRAWRGEGTGCVLLEKHAPDDWYEAMRTLIEDEALRRRLAGEALAFAETRSMAAWAPAWQRVYEDAVTRSVGARRLRRESLPA